MSILEETQTGLSPAERALNEMDKQRAETQSLKLTNAVKTNPDQYAQDRKLANETGLPVGTVERNRQDVDLKARQDRIKKFQSLLDTTPGLKEAFENDDFARVAHDEVEDLGAIETIFQGARAVLDGPRQAASDFVGYVPSVLRGTDDLIDSGFTKLEQGIDSFLPGFKDEVNRIRNSDDFDPILPDATDLLDAAAEPVQKFSDAIAVPDERRNLYTDISGGLGQMGAQIASIIINPGLGTAGLFAQGADQQGQRADAAGATPEQRANAVLLGAGVTALTERLGLDFLLNRIPPKIKNDILRVATDIGIGGGIEAAQEALEGAAHNLIARGFYEPDAEIFEGLEREAIVAGGTGAVARGIVNAITPGKQRIDETQAAQKGAAEAKALDNIVKNARERKLLGRDREAFQGLVKRMADQNNAENVYVSGEAVNTLYQSGVDLEDMYEAIPEARDQFKESQATGGDLILPTEKFVSFVAENEKYDGLISESRFSPDALPAKNIEEINSEIQIALNEYAELQAQGDDVTQADLTPEQQIFDDVYKQMTNAGSTPHVASQQAAIQRAYWVTRARELDQNPFEIYQGENLKVRQQRPEFSTPKDLGFLFTPAEVSTIQSRVSAAAVNQVPAAIDIKRALTVQAEPVNRNNKRQVEKVLGGKVDDALSIIKRIGLSTGLKAGERETLKSTPAKFRKKGKLVNYYNTEFREALGENNTSLINQVMRDDGVEIDGVIEALHEAGFFPQYQEMNQVPDDAAMDIISRAASGDLVLPAEQQTALDDKLNDQDQLQDFVDQLDITPESTVEDIAERMAQIYSDGGQDLYQSYNQVITGGVMFRNLSGQGDVNNLETGIPVKFHYSHNKESATGIFGKPKKGDQYFRDFEPSGKYVNVISKDRFDGNESDGQFDVGTLAFVNPIIIDNNNSEWKKDLSEQYDGKTGKDLSKAVIAAGHDGIITTEGGKYISEVVDLTTFDEAKALYQSKVIEDTDDLVVLHNLSTRNLANADRMGGLPVPSLAITKANSGFNNFGEVTLVGDSALVNPKLSRANRVFAADVYSPRYPSVQHQLDSRAFDNLMSDKLEPLAGELESSIRRIRHEIEDSGVEALAKNDAVMYAYLKEQGKAPKPKYVKQQKDIVDENPELKKFAGQHTFELMESDEFLSIIEKAFVEKMIAKPRLASKRVDPETERAQIMERFFEDGKLSENIARDYAYTVQNWRPPSKEKKVDEYETAKAIRSKFKKSGEQAFTDWISDTFQPVISREVIFDGYTNSGNRRYLDHNLDNVVRILKRGIRSAEGFNYGLGNVRSMVAPEFKSVQGIKDGRDLIVTDEQFEVLRTEADQKLFDLAEKYGPRSKNGGRFRALDSFTGVLAEVGETRNVRKVMNEYYNDITDADLNEISDFMDALKNMPTQYFEAKIQRAVGINEFQGALVPRGKSYDDTVQLLEQRGLKVRRYKEGDADDRTRALQGFKKTFFQRNKVKGVRGSITFKEMETVIELGKNSDLSTFMHESAHLFVKKTREIAQGEGAPERTVKIYRDMEKFVGAEPDANFTVDQEEKLARAFEAYLREGRAPSVGLRDAFRSIQSWLIRIYKTIRGLDVELTPEIRETFDRMLATDEEIEVAAAQADFELDPAISEMLNKQERDDYAKRQANAIERAREILLKDNLRQVTLKETVAYKAEREVVRDEAMSDIQSQRIQKAFKIFTTGEDFDGNKREIKLDKQDLIDRFGKDVLNSLPRGRQRVYSTSGGMSIDNAAPLFGYTSGDAMITDMLRLVKPEVLVEQRTDEIMNDRYGNMLTDGTLEREARAAVNNTERGELIATELSYIARQTGERATPADLARATAKDVISKKRVPLAQQFSRFVTAQVKAAKDAQLALSKKDYAKAASEKRKQLLNHYLFMEARDASKEVTATLRLMKRMDSKTSRQNIDPEYMEQIDALLEKYDFTNKPAFFDFKRGLGARDSSKRKRLEDFIREREAAGDAISLDDLPDRLRADEGKQSYKELTMQEFRDLRDAVQQFAHLGRLKNKLILGKEKRDLQAVATEVADTIGKNTKKSKFKIGKRRNKFASLGREYGLNILHPTTILRELDGFENLGPVYEHIKGVIDRAVSSKLLPLEQEMAAKVDELFSVYSVRERGVMSSNRIHVPEMEDSLTKFEIIGMAMNYGNKGNRQAMAEGFGLTDQQVKGILDRHMDKRDWDYVQSVWDYVGSLWPQISALEKKRKGVEPERVENAKVQTAFGEYAGGYYPLKYDAELDLRVNEETAEEMMNHYRNGRFSKAQTRKGHTIERVGSGGRPVRLDMNVLASHLKQVAYDTTMHEAITYSDKVLHHETVRGAFQDAGMNDTWRTLDLWLKDAALGEIRSGDFLERSLRHVRTGFTISKLAWNVGTILVQPLGYTHTTSVLGSRYALEGLKAVTSSPLRGEKSVFKLVHEMSDFMKTRTDTWNKDISETMITTKELVFKDRWGVEAEVKDKVLRPIQSSGFYVLGKAQYLVDVATWYGAYKKGLNDFDGDEGKAVHFADDTVKRAQASGIFSDRAGFERGTISNNLRQSEFVKAFTTLASYMIAKGNIAYEKTKRNDFKSPTKTLGWAIDMSLLFMLEAMVLAAMRSTWPDDEEEIPGFLARELGVQVAGTLPIVREFVSETQGFRGGGPLVSFIGDVGKATTQISQGEFDAALIKSVNNVGGVIFKMPSSQINRPIDAAFRDADGEDIDLIDYFYWRDKD